MNRKTRTFKRTMLKAVATPVFIVGGLGLGITLQGPAPLGDIEQAPAEPSRIERMVAGGECWTGGEGHPYPSRVWLNTPDGPVLRGQATVDRLLTAWDLDDVAAFCKAG